jgi:hypothetical protein
MAAAEGIAARIEGVQAAAGSGGSSGERASGSGGTEGAAGSGGTGVWAETAPGETNADERSWYSYDVGQWPTAVTEDRVRVNSV